MKRKRNDQHYLEYQGEIHIGDDGVESCGTDCGIDWTRKDYDIPYPTSLKFHSKTPRCKVCFGLKPKRCRSCGHIIKD